MSFSCENVVHLSDNGIDILPGNFVNNINSTIFKKIFKSVNLNWQEVVHNEQQANVDTLLGQSNDWKSSGKTLLTSYDTEMYEKTYKKIL